MNYQPYAEFQKGRADWIPVLPVHWEHLLGRRVFGNRRDKPLPDDPQLAATQKYGVLPQAEFMEREGQKVALALKGVDGFRHVQKGDFVISLRSFEGGIEFSPYSGCVSPAYTVLSPKRKIESSFFRYLLKSAPYIAALQSTTDSLRDGKSITYDQFAAIPLPIPSVSEQSTIAIFLDRETAKIDTLIDRQEQLIKLLEEKRQAVISHAVTKGLNPNVRMKDSGVEWLGEVPEHWDVVALKRLVEHPIIDGPHETPVKCDDGIPFVSAEAISGGFVDFGKKWGYISQEDFDRFSKRYKPRIRDILLIKLGATTGIPAIVETDAEFGIWVPLAAIRLKSGLEPRFFLNVLRSDNLKTAYQLNWTYGTQQTLGLRTISNLRVPVPPKREMQDIVSFLDPHIVRFQAITDRSQAALALLRERRSALVSAAVTGKIDVREVA